MGLEQTEMTHLCFVGFAALYGWLGFKLLEAVIFNLALTPY